MSKVLDPCQQIERSIITKYRKTLWNPFIAAVKRCRLIAEGDRIAACISRGKGLHAHGKADAGALPPFRRAL